MARLRRHRTTPLIPSLLITILITIDVTWLWCVQMQQNEMVGKVMDELKRKGMYSVNHQVRRTTSTPYAPYALPLVCQRVVLLRAAGFGLPVAPIGLGVSGKLVNS